MSDFDQIIQTIRAAEKTEEKTQLTQYLMNVLGRIPSVDGEDKTALSDFAFAEMARVDKLVGETENYRDKDALFAYADPLFGLVMKLYAKPDDIPATNLETAKRLRAVMDREMFLENAVDEMARKDPVTRADTERLMCFAVPVTDEYRKGKLWQGLLHYENEMKRMDDDARSVIADYLASELERYLGMGGADGLELAADAARLFMNDRVAALLTRVTEECDRASAFYALESLARTGHTVGAGPVRALAEDLEYASLTYQTLERAGQASLFPAEYASPDYLAKSDLAHWLTYPTELGCLPDEIEYLGVYRRGLFKKETYHILRFRSGSDNLADDRKGRWLVGWSNDDGGTFSEFEPYDTYDTGDVKKTLTRIGKAIG